jgi:hypothetical protein
MARLSTTRRRSIDRTRRGAATGPPRARFLPGTDLRARAALVLTTMPGGLKLARPAHAGAFDQAVATLRQHFRLLEAAGFGWFLVYRSRSGGAPADPLSRIGTSAPFSRGMTARPRSPFHTPCLNQPLQ